jgi:SPP1 family predicted phage head-tail adaptor
MGQAALFIDKARPVGRLRTRLTLEIPVETPDGAGGVTRSWTSAGALWGAIRVWQSEPGRAPEQEGALISHAITIRYRGDIDTQCRLRRGNRLFRVRGLVDPDEKRRRLVCLCEEERP